MKHAFFSLLIMILTIGSVSAQEYKMTYDVYASGFHVLEASMDMDIQSNEKYKTTIFTATRGFLKNLAPWQGTFYAEGVIKKAGYFQPTLHKSVAIWQGEEEVKEYKYKQDGTFLAFSKVEEGVDKTPTDLNSDLWNNTTDILSAMLNTLAAIDNQNACTGTAEIFDGKRRFELSFNPLEKVALKSSRYNTFEGDAFKCTAEVKPKGGRWHKKPRGWLSIQEQGREKGKLPTIWMGKPAGLDRYVPVKLLVKTTYGTLFLHLTSAKKLEEI